MSGFESEIQLQDRNMRTLTKLILMNLLLPFAATSKLNASPEEDVKTVAALDMKYQAAVKANDGPDFGGRLRVGNRAWQSLQQSRSN
jgi:hypothetical protein